MGSAQGEESAKEDPLVTGRAGAVVRFSDVAATLDALLVVPLGFRKPSQRFLETSRNAIFPRRIFG